MTSTRGPGVGPKTLELFEQAARSSKLWLDNARRLRQAADLIGEAFVRDLLTGAARGSGPVYDLPHYYSGPIFLMLAGSSIESLIKGIVASDRPDVVHKGCLARWFTTHDLPTLFRLAGINLPDAQSRFVRRLSKFTSPGRYPVPKRLEDVGARMVSSTDLQAFRDLYDRIEVLLKRRIGR